MINVFNFHNAFKRSQIEIVSNIPRKLFWDYWDYLVPCQKEKLPESITFKIVAGKKNYDIIRLFECAHNFLSQEFIDVLSKFMDMSDKCYPIKVEGAEKQYYVIYNLDHFPWLNREKATATFDNEPPFFEGTEIKTPLFSIKDTRYFVVTEELKDALIKNKISNIDFTESFLCTKKEYREWRRSQGKQRTK